MLKSSGITRDSERMENCRLLPGRGSVQIPDAPVSNHTFQERPH